MVFVSLNLMIHLLNGYFGKSTKVNIKCEEENFSRTVSFQELEHPF